MGEPSRNLQSTKPQKINSGYQRELLNRGFFRKNGRLTEDDEMKISPFRGLFVIGAIILYWEMILMLLSYANMGWNLLCPVIASAGLGAVISLLSGMTKSRKLNFTISFLLQIVVCIWFCMQILCYEVNSEFLSIYSDISKYHFSDTFGRAFVGSCWKLLLLILPLIFEVIIFKLYDRVRIDILGFDKRNSLCYILIVIVLVSSFCAGIFAVSYASGKNEKIKNISLAKQSSHNEKIGNYGIVMGELQEIKVHIFD